MGRKNINTGNNIFLCITVTILTLTFSCASFNDVQKRQYTGELFLHSEKLLAENDFEGAIQENRKVLSLFVNGPPGDRALFNIALIYAHYSNPARSYQKTLQYFSRLIKEHPDSPYSEEAKVWSSVIRIIEQSKQVDIEIEKKKKEMAR